MRRRRGLGLDRFLLLLFALRAFALDRGRSRAGGHPHHLFSHIIRLSFEHVTWGADGRLALDRRCREGDAAEIELESRCYRWRNGVGPHFFWRVGYLMFVSRLVDR